MIGVLCDNGDIGLHNHVITNFYDHWSTISEIKSDPRKKLHWTAFVIFLLPGPLDGCIICTEMSRSSLAASNFAPRHHISAFSSSEHHYWGGISTFDAHNTRLLCWSRCALYQKPGWMVLEQWSMSWLSWGSATRWCARKLLSDLQVISRRRGLERVQIFVNIQVCFTRQLRAIWAPLAVLRLVYSINLREGCKKKKGPFS